jgi:hypothetical protein
MTTTQVLEPLVEYSCTGKAIFKSGQTVDSEFSVKQLRDGSIVGEVKISGLETGTALDLGLSDVGGFALEGLEHKYDSTIRVEDCYFTRRQPGATGLYAEFIAGDVIISRELLDRKLARSARVLFSITNMYKTFRVIVDSPLGTMQIEHDPDIDSLERLMTHQRISLVTSYIEIFADNAPGMTVKELMEKSIETVEGFLQITRLAQTCWHDWCNLSIYEKEEHGEDATLVLLKMRLPWRKLPVSRGLTNVAHSDFFIRDAYKGYRKELESELGFESALYWYIESNVATDVAQSKYLLACTCLELLTDRFAKKNGNEYVFDPEEAFGKFYDVLKEKAHEWIERNVSSKEQEHKKDQIRGALLGINRPSFRSKIEALLGEWNVRYDDIDLDVGKIVRIRNEITHMGTSTSGSIIQVYYKLDVLLTRIFLSMLGYEGAYWDWVKDGFVNMKDVKLAT